MDKAKQKAIEFLESSPTLFDKHFDCVWYKDKNVLKALEIYKQELRQLVRKEIDKMLKCNRHFSNPIKK